MLRMCRFVTVLPRSTKCPCHVLHPERIDTLLHYKRSNVCLVMQEFNGKDNTVLEKIEDNGGCSGWSREKVATLRKLLA